MLLYMDSSACCFYLYRRLVGAGLVDGACLKEGKEWEFPRSSHGKKEEPMG